MYSWYIAYLFTVYTVKECEKYISFKLFQAGLHWETNSVPLESKRLIRKSPLLIFKKRTFFHYLCTKHLYVPSPYT